MKKFIVFFSLCLVTSMTYAETKKIPQFSNDKVNVWETVIYPSKQQVLKMHRHDHDRVLIAFDDVTLKIENDKGKSSLLTLKKDKAYYLAKDVPGEMHTDENLGKKPVKFLIIELR